MKLVTINTHSLIEENYPQKLEQFVDFIRREEPDLIAMQEVNQSFLSPLYTNSLPGFSPITDILPPIRTDNHALQAALRLHACNLPYNWVWLPVKVGYGKYDEGMAIFSKSPIIETDHFYISKFQDYDYWKTRQILGIKTADCDDWFYTVHMGWWNDDEDPFEKQWVKFEEHLKQKNHFGNFWLLGDFNSPAEVRDEGYDLVTSSGWIDSYVSAKRKDCGITVEGIIDGWKDKLQDQDSLNGMRIDHIFTKKERNIQSSKVIFSGQQEPVISDHFGIMIEL